MQITSTLFDCNSKYIFLHGYLGNHWFSIPSLLEIYKNHFKRRSRASKQRHSDFHFPTRYFHPHTHTRIQRTKYLHYVCAGYTLRKVCVCVSKQNISVPGHISRLTYRHVVYPVKNKHCVILLYTSVWNTGDAHFTLKYSHGNSLFIV